MNIPGLLCVDPGQTALLKRLATMMGSSFMEENWFITWLSALDSIDVTCERKCELMHALFLDDLSVHAPYQGVYCLEDLSAATGAFRYSELKPVRSLSTEVADPEGFVSAFEALITPKEEVLLEAQRQKMKPISVFDWSAEMEQGNDHIYFYAWATDPSQRGKGALRRLLNPMFDYADKEGLNCYLDCFADRLQSMYEHLGFEVIDEFHSPEFDIYERRMVRRCL